MGQLFDTKPYIATEELRKMQSAPTNQRVSRDINGLIFVAKIIIISKILPDIEQSKPVGTRLNTSRRLFGLLMNNLIRPASACFIAKLDSQAMSHVAK
jgi:hypothetical protein